MAQYRENCVEVFNEDGASALIQTEGGESFLHCSVNNLSHSLIKKMKLELKRIVDKRKESGNSRPLFSYTQNPKFAKLMGGSYLAEFSVSGVRYEVWMWE